MAAVSRLAVLAEAGLHQQRAVCAETSAVPTSALVVLDAGRGEFFVRERYAAVPAQDLYQAPYSGAAREWLCSLEDLRTLSVDRPVVVAEERLVERLAGRQLILRPLSVADALIPVLHCLQQGGSDVATVDANYVWGESDIYHPAQTSADQTSVVPMTGPQSSAGQISAGQNPAAQPSASQISHEPK